MSMPRMLGDLNYKDVTDSLIDYLCEIQGVVPTIEMLLEIGFHELDVYALLFEKEDIEKAKLNIKEKQKGE